MKLLPCLRFILVALTSGCSTAPADSPIPVPRQPRAPWSQPALAGSAVPAVYLTEWRKAENRQACALIAPVLDAAGATPRRANFAGGWAVAYDTGATRSAFGIAGTGSNATDPAYSDWPQQKGWADGSTAGYGPEGGTGPNQLAYLRVSGQDCLYNVWSRLGTEHLEQLIDSLRLVRTSGD